MLNSFFKRPTCHLAALVSSLFLVQSVQGALLAYEPFTNAPGTALIGSSDGFGFSGAWQDYNTSLGVATNTGYGFDYTDSLGNTLVTVGGAGFFQGLTSANSSMQPIRQLSFSRGTNGSDGTSTWISFIAVRQGPAGTLAGNPYGRGANLDHDIHTGNIQKLAVGNSSSVNTNTVGLIPTGSANNLRSSTVPFGNFTNFIVVRIDHVPDGAINDNAYLFVNPLLDAEPSTNTASAVSLGSFDFSFDRIRVFAGGNNGAAQPYAEFVIDEYRIGETFADVTPYTDGTTPPSTNGPLVITNAYLLPGNIVISGMGGSNNGPYQVLTTNDITAQPTNWTVIATNSFDANGNFISTNPTAPGSAQQFFRVMQGGSLPVTGVAPTIISQPSSNTVTLGQNVTFSMIATGTPTLVYQWYFNTNTVLAEATNNSYTVTNAQSTNLGEYFVIVANDYGSKTSSVVTLTESPLLMPDAYFVSPSGNDSNAGTESSPFQTINKGLSVITSGGVVYMRAGTYALSSRLNLNGTGGSGANTKRLWAYPGEFPTIDSTGNSSDGVGISGWFYHLKGLTVIKAGHNGINISGHSNVVEYCTVRDNGNTGLHITGGSSGSTYPSYNLILNCDAYLNYDPPVGGNADGFSAKWNLGPGNTFSGCRAWRNSDDGWDLWMGTSPVVITNCWAFYNGTNYWANPSFDGNGQGFKIGGNYVGTPHRVVRCLSFLNESGGIDQNNNTAGQTVDQNTCWGNRGRNINLNHNSNNAPTTGVHVVRNNLSFGGIGGDSFASGTLFTNNSWQVISSPAVNSTDFQSMIAESVDGPRQADGSLPVLPFMRPVDGGRLIDAGIDIGDPYLGAAPDLGWVEVE